MVPMEALQMALEKEIDAAEFYKKMAIQHSEIRDLFAELASVEQKHRKMIEAEMVKLRM